MNRLATIQCKITNLLKHWFDFQLKKLTETMDRMAVIDAKKVLKQRLDFLVKEKVETMDGLAITQGQTIVETTFRFSD